MPAAPAAPCPRPGHPAAAACAAPGVLAGVALRAAASPATALPWPPAVALAARR
jgi:hypothetical protein